MVIERGSWLGVDVGSACSKVYCFCLLCSDGNGVIEVFFERGQIRGPANNLIFPGAYTSQFLDLTLPNWLSEASEEGAKQILSQSELVRRWRQAVTRREGNIGACLDSPCGFAVAGRIGGIQKSPLSNHFQHPRSAHSSKA